MNRGHPLRRANLGKLMLNSFTMGPPTFAKMGDKTAPIMILYTSAKKQSSFFHRGQFCSHLSIASPRCQGARRVLGARAPFKLKHYRLTT